MSDDIELANVNGTINPPERALIPVNDHGFLYGDSVYETVRTYDRRPFLVGAHLQRLARSAASIRLRLPWDRDHIARETRRTVAAARPPGAGVEFAIRIIASRGPGPMGYNVQECGSPSLVILLRRLPPLPRDQREVGISAAITSVRRNPIEALDPGIKSSNLLNNILATQEARDRGSDEAILFNTHGHLAEGALTNVFFVEGGRLRTPSIACGILSGVTRDLVIELARRDGIPCEEGAYPREAVDRADEVFLTSTTREILPVAILDGRRLGPGGAGRGPVTARIQDLFRGHVEEFLRQRNEGSGDA